MKSIVEFVLIVTSLLMVTMCFAAPSFQDITGESYPENHRIMAPISQIGIPGSIAARPFYYNPQDLLQVEDITRPEEHHLERRQAMLGGGMGGAGAGASAQATAMGGGMGFGGLPFMGGMFPFMG